MHIIAALSIDLALLTPALDRPEVDIIETLSELSAEARLVAPSYLGLRLDIAGETPFTFTAMEDHAAPEEVCSSLLIGLAHGGPARAEAAISLILYAAQPGAFVDLAADLSWLTGLDLSDDIIDQHLCPTARPTNEATIHATSVINQAIGVLIGRGHLPREAHEELTEQAADAGTDRYAAANLILTGLATDPDPDPDPGIDLS